MQSIESSNHKLLKSEYEIITVTADTDFNLFDIIDYIKFNNTQKKPWHIAVASNRRDWLQDTQQTIRTTK